MALQLRRGNRGLLAARAGPDHQYVEVIHTSQCDHARHPFERLTGRRVERHVQPRSLPTGRQRHALGVTGCALHTDHRPLVQLIQIARARIGAGAAQPGVDRVELVLPAWPLRVQVHPGGRDALPEELLARPVERRVVGRAQPHRAGRGHAETLLVQPSVAIMKHVAWRLVRPREPRSDHHVGRAGRERERDIAPGPTPTLTMSAPASIRSRTPSGVTTFPAAIGTGPPAGGPARRIAASAAIIFSWWPCAVST